MFSSRLAWDTPKNRLSLALEARRPEFDLTASNPTRAGFAYSREIVEALADERGLVYAPRTGDVETLTMYAASTSEGYSWLFKLLCDPGDAVLTPRPSYPLFEFLAHLDSVEIVNYPLQYAEGWWVDFAALERAITPRTRAVLVVHPNNPTGSYLKREEMEKLTRLCAERGLALVSDEVFAEYACGEDDSRCATLGGNGKCLTFTLEGLSKSAGLPQMKAAWIGISGPGAEEAFARLELIADTYLSVSTPVMLGLERLRELGVGVQGQIRERTRRNLGVLELSGLRPLRVEGGWYGIVPLPRWKSEEEWALELLEQDGVLVQPGYFYDFESEGWAVVSLLTPEGEFDQGLERMKKRFTSPSSSTSP
jgi:alanine-synthesizing transaminase